MSPMDADSERRDEQTYSVIGAGMAVNGELGHGFLDQFIMASGLKKALLLSFGAQRLEFKRLVFYLRLSASSADFSSFADQRDGRIEATGRDIAKRCLRR